VEKTSEACAFRKIGSKDDLRHVIFAHLRAVHSSCRSSRIRWCQSCSICSSQVGREKSRARPVILCVSFGCVSDVSPRL